MHRGSRSSWKTLILTSALVVSGCWGDGPTAPGICEGDAVALDEYCWTFLGLESEWIAEIAVTPWGTFVGTNDSGIFRLEDDGSWTPLGPTSWHERLVPRALLYVDTDPPRLLAGLDFRDDSNDTTRAAVYASFDRGESWVPSDGGLSETAPYPWQFGIFVDDLEADPGDPNRVFMSNCHGVLRSLDAGETWEFVFGGFDFCAWFDDILIDPSRSGRIWLAGQGNYFVASVGFSSDWGETWEGDALTCDGSLYETPVHTLALDPDIPDRLYVGAEIGLFQSDAAGARDSWHCPGGPRGAVVGFAHFNDGLFATTVFLDRTVDENGGVVELTELGLYRTTDNGVRWDSLAVPAGSAGATAVAVDPDATRLLVGTREGIWSVAPR